MFVGAFRHSPSGVARAKRGVARVKLVNGARGEGIIFIR